MNPLLRMPRLDNSAHLEDCRRRSAQRPLTTHPETRPDNAVRQRHHPSESPTDAAAPRHS